MGRCHDLIALIKNVERSVESNYLRSKVSILILQYLLHVSVGCIRYFISLNEVECGFMKRIDEIDGLLDVREVLTVNGDCTSDDPSKEGRGRTGRRVSKEGGRGRDPLESSRLREDEADSWSIVDGVGGCG